MPKPTSSKHKQTNINKAIDEHITQTPSSLDHTAMQTSETSPMEIFETSSMETTETSPMETSSYTQPDFNEARLLSQWGEGEHMRPSTMSQP